LIQSPSISSSNRPVENPLKHLVRAPPARFGFTMAMPGAPKQAVTVAPLPSTGIYVQAAHLCGGIHNDADDSGFLGGPPPPTTSEVDTPACVTGEYRA